MDDVDDNATMMLTSTFVKNGHTEKKRQRPRQHCVEDESGTIATTNNNTIYRPASVEEQDRFVFKEKKAVSYAALDPEQLMPLMPTRSTDGTSFVLPTRRSPLSLSIDPIEEVVDAVVCTEPISMVPTYSHQLNVPITTQLPSKMISTITVSKTITDQSERKEQDIVVTDASFLRHPPGFDRSIKGQDRWHRATRNDGCLNNNGTYDQWTGTGFQIVQQLETQQQQNKPRIPPGFENHHPASSL